ncbi:hypothetical protein LUZ60_002417 [Juncus effusus]|nr:hypothetical protein LUZ60_002417 [Juncus effusus]
MASLSLPSMKVLNSFQVSPSPSLGSAPNQAIIPLTFSDIVWINDPPLETLFFYPFSHLNSNSDRFMRFISSLKSSLSNTLKSFYPLAGKLHCRTGTRTGTKFEIIYEEGDFVAFVVSECNNGRFDELASFHPRSVSHLQRLIPCLSKSDESQPLFAVQVTIFPDQGIVLGISLHHSVCDGTSLMLFFQSWIVTCLSSSTDSSFKPIIDRTIIPDSLDKYSKVCRGNSKPKDFVPPSNDTFLATFIIKKENIQRLKQFISSKSEEMKKSFHCSTTVVVFAYAWICYVKSRAKEESDKKEKHGLLFQVDFRTRIQPPVPKTYFGNFIGPCMVQTDRADLESENGVVLAAELIGRAIEELSYGEKLANDLVKSFEFERSVSSLLTVAGSPRFRVYEADFGLDKPKKVEIVSIAKTGAISVAESREEPGGIEIGIALKQSEMDCFGKCFNDGLTFD